MKLIKLTSAATGKAFPLNADAITVVTYPTFDNSEVALYNDDRSAKCVVVIGAARYPVRETMQEVYDKAVLAGTMEKFP